MPRLVFADLRASLESRGWTVSEEISLIRIFVHPKGQTLTVWLDIEPEEYVALALPGRHVSTEAPTIFRLQFK